MPVISGGGGGGNTTAQVVASGKVIPVAHPAGVTVDTTTYDDPIAGGGSKLTTLVFAGAVSGLAFARSGDAFPRLVIGSSMADGIVIGDGTQDPYNTRGGAVAFDSIGIKLLTVGATQSGLSNLQAAFTAAQPPRVDQVSPLFTITSGALPTVQLVTATGAQILTTRDAETITPCTFNPGAATTATVTVALSPDNVTYSTLGIETVPAGVALDGTIHLVKVRVPAGWYLKLTVNAQAVLGLTTYY